MTTPSKHKYRNKYYTLTELSKISSKYLKEDVNTAQFRTRLSLRNDNVKEAVEFVTRVNVGRKKMTR